MKKKIILAFVAAVIAVFACFAFTGCGAELGQDTDLQMDKKYTWKEDENDYSYVIFYSNGTGEYRVLDVDTDPRFTYDDEDYLIKFKYTFVDSDDSAVVCFYDSVEYGAKHGNPKISSTWTRLFTVSKNVLCYAGGSGYSFYINEDYLESTLTNFGK